jgi:hypothetical protein
VVKHGLWSNNTVNFTVEVCEDLGKVRLEHTKGISEELVERFPDKFATDFETNKKLVKAFTMFPQESSGIGLLVT